MLELNTLYNMDCMEGMAQFPDKFFELAIVSQSVKPIGGALNVGKISRLCFEWGIVRRKHSIDLGNVHIKLTRNVGIIGICFMQLDCFLIIMISQFVMVTPAQGINTQVKSSGHILVAQISNLAGVKANKSENIDLAVVVTSSIVFSVAFDIKNICLAFLCSLRDHPWIGCGLDLNTPQTSAIIHENIIGKPLFTGKGNKTLHDKVCTHKIFSGFTNLQLVTESHKITSHTLYNTYYGVSSAKLKAVA